MLERIPLVYCGPICDCNEEVPKDAAGLALSEFMDGWHSVLDDLSPLGCSHDESPLEPEFSSISFSICVKGGVGDNIDVLACRRAARREGVDDDAARVDSGCVEVFSGGPLIEAWAVFAERDDVGGPEVNIERLGVLNEVIVCAVARPRSDADLFCRCEAALDTRGADILLVRWPREDEAGIETGNCHDGA